MKTRPLNLNFRRWGSSGKPLIILHGLFGSTVNWQSIGLQLSEQWSVIALDLRNHGDSPHHPDFSYTALVEDLNAFMAQQQMEKAILMGHSLGGKIVMSFADRFPHKAERLIIVDIAPKPYPASHRDLLQAMIDLDLSRIKSRKEALDALAPAIPSLAIRHFLLKSLKRGSDGRYRWQINLDAIDHHLDALSQGPTLKHPYPNPTLFISGSASGYITAEDADPIYRLYPNARIVTIDGTGHWLHADAQAQTVETIRAFLQSPS
jgi:pimeloyl-ACP methyl ester carboxylesterase